MGISKTYHELLFVHMQCCGVEMISLILQGFDVRDSVLNQMLNHTKRTKICRN